MPKLKTTSSSGFELIPEHEVVPARLVEVTANSFKLKDTGEEIHKLRWVFVVTQPGPFEGKEVWGNSSQVFTAHPNCIAYNWAVAITGTEFQDGDDFDTDDIMGAPCRIMIKHTTDKQERTWMRVKEVLPPKAGTGAQDIPF
jgi:hypothetical protein